MSEYKDMMNYPKKKKTKKEKLQKSTILEGIKDEFGFSTDKVLKEVGASSEYRPYVIKIEKYYKEYWDAVKDFEKVLEKKGLKKPASILHRKYMKLVVQFHQWFKIMLRKLL